MYYTFLVSQEAKILIVFYSFIRKAKIGDLARKVTIVFKAISYLIV
jgi:hypothetical protein